MTCVSVVRNASSAAPDKLFGSTFAKLPRIRIDPTVGNMVVPSELNACAKVNRLLTVAGFPSMEISGLATTCTVVMSAAKTNNASKNKPNTLCDEAGINKTHPAVMIKSPVTADRM